jgi:hypothetical protein
MTSTEGARNEFMLRTFSVTLRLEIILGTSLMCLAVPTAHAEVLIEQTGEWPINWLAALANSEAGFVMRSSKTLDGNGIISFCEMRSRKNSTRGCVEAISQSSCGRRSGALFGIVQVGDVCREALACVPIGTHRPCRLASS